MKAYFFFAAAITTFFATSPDSLLAQKGSGPFVYESPREFFGRGDFNGDGLEDVVIADKETGKYRLGYMGSTGMFGWVDNRPSGIKGISGFGIGRVLGTNANGLVFASADANQITLVDVGSSTASSRPVAVPFSAALGPSAVVPVDIGGEGNTPVADLYVGSIYNSPDANMLTLVRNDGSEYPKVGEGTFAGPAVRGNAVSVKPGQGELVCFLVNEESGDTFKAEDVSSGKPVAVLSLPGLPTGSDYAVGNFTASPLAQFLFYKPGAPELTVRPVEEAGGKLQFGQGMKFDLKQPIRRILTLSQGVGQKLLVIFGEGESAGIYNFDGKQGPVLGQTLNATNDLFTAGASLPSGFVLFSQPASAGKFSNRYQVYTISGPGYALSMFGSLPSLADNDNITIPDIHSRIAGKSGAMEGEPKAYTNTIPGTRVSYVMVPIAGGEFLMGSPEAEPDRKPDEGPQHKVKISPFWMGQCEITWNEYELFMYPDEERRTRATVPTDEAGDKLADAVTHPSKPYVEMSFGMGKDGFPAISMTQHAANKYCQWLSAKTGHFYRLPTEAEWEYACRAGTSTKYFFGDDVSKLKDYGWYEQNSDFKYQKVGKKKPNPWGLYDMCGNVVEWVLDQYAADYYGKCNANGVVSDPWNRATKPYPHAVKGGSWDDEAKMLRSAARRGSDRTWKMQDPQLPKSIWYFSDAQFVGFRIVRPLKVPPPEEMQRCWSSGVERD